MNTTTYITQQINRFTSGKVFDYDDLSIDSSQMTAAAKALSRLVSEGKIERFQKGKYYIPEKTVFGKLKPSDSEILNTYLFNKKKQVAYITGTRLYNMLGLTTQVPVTVTMASWDKQFNKDFGKLRVKSTRSYLPVTSTNASYLQVLDTIKDFKRIPDAENGVLLQFLKNTFSEYSDKDLKRIVTYAKAYPPKVNALLGAILEALQITIFSKELQKKINTLSRYSFGINKTELPTIKNWNIN